MADVKNHATLPTSLVSYWELEEGSGSRVDSHGSNDLTDNNTVLSATGIQGDGADFESGNSEFLSIADGGQSGLDITGDLSIALWMKPESLARNQTFLSKDDVTNRSYLFDVRSDNKLQVTYKNGAAKTQTVQTTASITSTGTWYHVAITIDVSAASITLYVDGSSVAETENATAATAIANTTAQFEIGRRGDAVQYFDGILDEVGIWSKILSASEITDLYNSGSGIPYEDAGGAAAGFMTTRSGYWGA